MKKNIKKNVDAHGNGYSSEANHETSSKGSKHDANLRKNGFYHFQIGLILAMLMVYAGLEASFAVKGENIANETEELVDNVEYYPELTKFKVEEVKTKTVNISKPKVVTNPDKLKIVDNDEVIKKGKEIIDISEDNSDKNLDINDIKEIIDEPVVEDIPFAVIEDIPLFPGCEKVKKNQRKKCFNEKMHKHIKRHFRYPSAEEEMGVEGRVNVMFKIDVDGSITELQVRGPSKGLEKEAARIISKLPKMIPGKQRGVPVRVPFGQPINFKLSN